MELYESRISAFLSGLLMDTLGLHSKGISLPSDDNGHVSIEVHAELSMGSTVHLASGKCSFRCLVGSVVTYDLHQTRTVTKRQVVRLLSASDRLDTI